MPAMATGSSDACPFCGRPLPTRDFALPGHRPMPITMPCGCERAREAAQAEERERIRSEKAEKFGEAWARAGIPDEFLHVAADFSMADALRSGEAVYIVGDTGRGKSHLACQYAKGYLVRSTTEERGLIACRRSLLYLNAGEMGSQIRTAWDRWDQTEEELYARWAGVDLLVLNDLGKGSTGEWMADNLFRLIDVRHDGHKATIFTSQYTTGALAGRYSKTDPATLKATLSRLRGWCRGVTLEGPDRRLANGKD